MTTEQKALAWDKLIALACFWCFLLPSKEACEFKRSLDDIEKSIEKTKKLG